MNNVCCFLGHRKIDESEELKTKLYGEIEKLITDKNVDTFLFGSKSQFINLTYRIVSEIKEKYPNVKRVYVRAEFPIISEQYERYLLDMYEETYYPSKIQNSGKAAYVERNFEMIDQSRYCIVYYDGRFSPKDRKSGTKIALDYALSRKKEIILLTEKNI